MLNMLYFEEFKQELSQHIRAGFCKANVCSMAHSPAKVWEDIGVEAAHDYRDGQGRVGYDYVLPGASM